MSNHIPLITKGKNDILSGLVCDFKKHTSKEIYNAIKGNNLESRKEWLCMIHAKYNKRVNNFQLWTHENHAVGLDSKEMMESRIEYTHDNPVRAGWVLNQEDYLYSSARNYAKLEAVMEIDLYKSVVKTTPRMGKLRIKS